MLNIQVIYGLKSDIVFFDQIGFKTNRLQKVMKLCEYEY